jgi:uncharacterized membrane protein
MLGLGTLLWLGSIAMVIIGPITAFNCARAIFSGEGVYDRESSSYMLWSNLLGIFLGLGLAWIGFVRLTGVGTSGGGCLTGG